MLTTTIAGRTWNYSHTIGRNAAAGNGFSQPMDVALAPGGVIYVLSRGQEGAGGVVAPNKRIGKVTIDEKFLGDFGRGGLTWPSSLAVDKDGNLYCSDEHENKVMVYDSDGQEIGHWGEAGANEGQLDAPTGLAFDSDNNLYISDAGNHRVQKFTKDGQFLSTFGEEGTEHGQFNRPWGNTVDKDGDVYVVDWGNDRVQKFSPDGEFKLEFGAASGPGGELDHPAGVAVDSEGDVYVSDWGNRRVQIYDSEGGTITALYGDAVEFSSWAKEVVESNPDVVKAYRRVKDKTALGLFSHPVGMAIDEEDRLIVTDTTRGRLQVYAKEKNYLDPQFNL